MNDQTQTTPWLTKFAVVMATVSSAIVVVVAAIFGLHLALCALGGAILGSLFIGWVASAVAAQEER